MNTETLGAWKPLLQQELSAPYFKALTARVDAARQETEVYPPAGQELFALEKTQPQAVRVVILGQDPYHEPGQAMGLAFSVTKGTVLPPSLRNIYQELHDDLGCKIPSNGYLEKWADQGVLMLNSVLTVQAHRANSHQGKGWEQFTDAAIRILNGQDRPIVFILWGSYAQRKAAFLNNPNHLILKSAHPSPLSVYRGFWGSKPFSKTNDFLTAHGVEPIDWQIEDI